MAIVKGPLFSVGAKGQFAKTIIYEEWKGRTYAKEYKVPGLTRYPAQRAVRAIIKFLSQQWPILQTIYPAMNYQPWYDLAAERQTSAIAEFCRYNSERILAGRAPSATYPATEQLTYGTIAACVFTAGVGYIQAVTNWDFMDAGWDLMLYMRSAVGTPTARELGAIIAPPTSGENYTATIENVEPGTYQCYNQAAGLDGAMGPAIEGPTEVIVT
jgi:hypothetical protein